MRPPVDARDGGAYLLRVGLKRSVWIRAGRLGRRRLAPGTYVYVGSARTNLRARVERHHRLACRRSGRSHWHIDYLLLHGWSRWLGADLWPGEDECALSMTIGEMPGVTVPIRGFGATDCRAGCPAHLYRVESSVVESLAVRGGRREEGL